MDKRFEQMIYEGRVERFLDELRWLYMERFDDMTAFGRLQGLLAEAYAKRACKEIDLVREANPEWFRTRNQLAMALSKGEALRADLSYLKMLGIGFLYPEESVSGEFIAACHNSEISICKSYEGDPITSAESFEAYVSGFLSCANAGVDLILLPLDAEVLSDAKPVPLHSLLRMLRLITQIVCPGVCLVLESNQSAAKAKAWFGTAEKPECQMVMNESFAANVWNAAATLDVELLKRELRAVNETPRNGLFLNFIASPKAIDWKLDYAALARREMQEEAHRAFLSKTFKDAAAGACASRCGFAQAGADKENIELSVRKHVMLQSLLLWQTGFPMLLCGDEMGLMDAGDWNAVKKGQLFEEMSVRGRIYREIRRMIELRTEDKVFSPNADCWTMETYEPSVLALGRYYDGQKLLGLFNFALEEKSIWLNEDDGFYTDLITGEEMEAQEINVPGYSRVFLKKEFY